MIQVHLCFVSQAKAKGYVVNSCLANPDNEAAIHSTTCTTNFSLVPRPYPLTRRNGLVNQVEFLGLAGALVTV